MKVVIVKSFNISGREFKKGEMLDIPEEAFNKLMLRGLVEPLIDVLKDDEGLKPEPIQAELNRACINCKGKKWLFLKPKAKVSAIQCLSCGHVELHIRGAT